MAVTVKQYPSSPNVTGTNLVCTLSSSLAGAPQYRYVTDIYESGSNNYITSIKTYPNIYGRGIVDLARELDDQLSPDYYWQITGSALPVNTVKTFNLRFGEEYATSISSSIISSPGTTDYSLKVFPGTVYKNEGGYNFNTSSYDYTGTGNKQYLTNNPATADTLDPTTGYADLVNSTDYGTLTLYQDINPVFPKTHGFIGAILYKVQDGVVTSPDQIRILLNTLSGSFETVPIGPKNLAAVTGSSTGKTYEELLDSGSFNFVVTSTDMGAYSYYINDKWDGIHPTPTVPGQNFYSPLTLKQCSDEYTRFAFVNDYGFWDYYNVYTPLRKNTQVQRNNYERPFVRYEDSIGSYNISDRGNAQYRTEYVDAYNITTDYLDETMAEWLKEMFDSPEVYIQKEEDFIPINITNVSVERNMDENRQKLFQYIIEFRYANQRQTR